MTAHLTAREKRSRASAAAAVARALAHTRPPEPPQDDDEALGALYPYVTPRRAAEIRREIQESRNV